MTNFIIDIFLTIYLIGFGFFLWEALWVISDKIIALLKGWAEPKKNAETIIAKEEGGLQ